MMAAFSFINPAFPLYTKAAMDNDLEKLVGTAKPAVGNNTLSQEARAFRRWLLLVKDPGHLKDLVSIFFHHTAWKDFLPGSSYEYIQLCQRLAAPDLDNKGLMIGMAVLAPALQNAGWAIFGGELNAQNKKRDEEHEAAMIRMRADQERAALITRVDLGSSKFVVKQRWIAETKEQLEVEAASQKSRWHPGGYGTWVSEIVPGTGEYEGKFTCTFSRGTTSD